MIDEGRERRASKVSLAASLKNVGGCRWSVTGRKRARRRPSGESFLAGWFFRGNFGAKLQRQNNNKPLVCTNVAETNQKRFARNEEKSAVPVSSKKSKILSSLATIGVKTHHENIFESRKRKILFVINFRRSLADTFGPLIASSFLACRCWLRKAINRVENSRFRQNRSERLHKTKIFTSKEKLCEWVRWWRVGKEIRVAPSRRVLNELWQLTPKKVKGTSAVAAMLKFHFWVLNSRSDFATVIGVNDILMCAMRKQTQSSLVT